MFRLTREVRFAINASPDDQLAQTTPSNSFGGFPSMTGLGHYFAIQVTLAGDLRERDSYLLNIKDVDRVVRDRAIPVVSQIISEDKFGGGGAVVRRLFDLHRDAWPRATLESLRLSLTPTLGLLINASEHPMVRLSQKFEFSASHRLYSSQLSEEENRRTFGKCSNPHGHGHNYEVEVTLLGEPDAHGIVMDVPAFERVVAETVIEPFDHKNLNVEVAQFRDVMPSVENIAMVIYRMLKPKLDFPKARLATVTIWETPKTWCTYSE